MVILSIFLCAPLHFSSGISIEGKAVEIWVQPLHCASSLQRFSHKSLNRTHFTDEKIGAQRPHNGLMADLGLRTGSLNLVLLPSQNLHLTGA